MRLTVMAAGHARGTAEGTLVDEFIHRAVQMGRNMGFPSIVAEEVAISKARDAKTRMADEAEKLAARIPAGAHIILLDAKGKGMTSEDFAEMLGALRDAGTKDLCFVIGGPDGLASLPGKRAGRSLAFGPQTWPHLMVRAMLAEQIYRALTILAGHPYHRA
ncbi:MAG: 23S rRNA (pseudouridine(1915)-N(3))-methyltransferase RlmH [Alphaproteobacteria bacterium]|nr:23S rRNA (pseudouridine(1915)-N(3))-methyltransferase RlmH [Alphaproteobacteria bacterium]MDE1986018.1 23S rRNA (pseudouridine(1915)-N(3))-methyltransferase RlmH [Alphaproteobacteria bacterium]MDE2164031.1 23S rRNA (pseudouridine(1915)-N(3))-methyltransferase RlmH [Alphaproteobacteria bacterium]MDE2266348.1 23S rRNA (pseudouridine(1915)-N(3))-methyltransferase RlmH [Alphaproteobacteria bacterium]MDE2499621.1 23S rRNA (pseudouridine(1915)-N(3))-methyltransferase RlmH [Alphaproteobacteria bact